MSEETNIQCPACTAELPPEAVECPWCGHLMTPRVEQVVMEEPAPIPVTEEPAQPTVPEEPVLPRIPEMTVLPVAEPGLTELSRVPDREPASSLKVMGIILIIFSLLALVFFAYQVLQDNLSRLVLVVPIFGMIIGFVSVAVAQRR